MELVSTCEGWVCEGRGWGAVLGIALESRVETGILLILRKGSDRLEIGKRVIIGLKLRSDSGLLIFQSIGKLAGLRLIRLIGIRGRHVRIRCGKLPITRVLGLSQRMNQLFITLKTICGIFLNHFPADCRQGLRAISSQLLNRLRHLGLVFRDALDDGPLVGTGVGRSRNGRACNQASRYRHENRPDANFELVLERHNRRCPNYPSYIWVKDASSSSLNSSSASPKSRILISPVLVRSKLEGLMSRWITPAFLT